MLLLLFCLNFLPDPDLHCTLFDQHTVHERMLESYVIAREKFLKPGGLMFPTTGSIVLAPLSDEVLYNEQLGVLYSVTSVLRNHILFNFCSQHFAYHL
jgi:hypothetical protein